MRRDWHARAVIAGLCSQEPHFPTIRTMIASLRRTSRRTAPIAQRSAHAAGASTHASAPAASTVPLAQMATATDSLSCG